MRAREAEWAGRTDEDVLVGHEEHVGIGSSYEASERKTDQPEMAAKLSDQGTETHS